jgi:hypothetical protein
MDIRGYQVYPQPAMEAAMGGRWLDEQGAFDPWRRGGVATLHQRAASRWPNRRGREMSAGGGEEMLAGATG